MNNKLVEKDVSDFIWNMKPHSCSLLIYASRHIQFSYPATIWQVTPGGEWELLNLKFTVDMSSQKRQDRIV